MSEGPPLRVLVVEDEMLIAFFIEDCLAEMGHEVVGPAARVAEALRLAETQAFDLALLDVNVAGEEVYPIAEVLKARGVPFAFLSGYSARGLRGDWAGSRMLQKPFAPPELKRCLAAMSGEA